MIVSARQFTNAAEMMAAAAAVRARCFGPSVKSRTRPAPAVIIPAVKLAKQVARKDLPLWARSPILFDAHVDAFATAMHIQAMQASGEIVMLKPRVSIAKIVAETLARFPGITIEDVRGESRTRRVVIARHHCMYEVKQQRPDQSFPDIGRWFGGRDHTTVLYAVRKIEAQRAKV